MVRKHWWQSIAAQLWVLVLCSAAFLGGLIAVNTQHEAAHERTVVSDGLLRRGTAQAQALEELLGHHSATIDALSSLASQRAVADPSGPTCASFLAPMQQAVPGAFLGVVDVHGTVLCSGSRPQTPSHPDHRFAAARLVTGLVAARRATTDGPFTDPGGGQLSMVSAAPLPGGAPRSLVFVSPTQILLAPQDREAGYTSVVVDTRNGLILMEHPARPDLVGRPLGSAPLASVVDRKGMTTVKGLDGVTSLYRSLAVTGTPYRLLIGQSTRTAYASVRASLLRNSAIALTAVLAMVLLGIVLHMRISRPARALVSSIRALGRDPEAGPAPVNGPVELAVVAHAFNETTQARRRADGLSRAILHNSQDHVLVLDRSFTLSFVAPRAHRLLGFRPGQSAASMAECIHPEDRATALSTAAEWAGGRGKDLHTETRIVLPDGMVRHVEVNGQDLRDDPYVAGLVLTCRDITERKEWEQHLAHQARHDPLTGLANRSLVLERLQELLDDRSRQPVAVCFLDLDRFKLINDSHGHAVGDRVLASLARRLQRAVRPGDLVGRFGGDEFVIVGANVEDEIGALAMAERVQGALIEPLRLLRRDLFVSGSIGIALGQEGDAAETILRNADTAMYRGKETGRGSVAFFDEQMQAQAQQRLRTENDLHGAVEREELQLHYQPLVTMQDGVVHGVEALVRWQHPQRGMVQPMDFIPVAEETGLVVPIGEWVLREACTWAVAAGRRLGRPLHVAVNLSARQLSARHLVHVVQSVLQSSGLAPGLLTLEVTETALVDDPASAAETLQALHCTGVRIAIDDFGTGWSSLTYLQQFPVDEIKLDRTFVSRVEDDRAAATIVGSLLEMAHTMGLSVTAEGIETAGQESFLRAHGCDVAQGFLYSRPVDAAAVETLIQTRRPLLVGPPATMES